MTILELTRLLNLYPLDTQVLCTANEGPLTYEYVTGAIYDEHAGTLELTTDD